MVLPLCIQYLDINEFGKLQDSLRLETTVFLLKNVLYEIVHSFNELIS